MSAAPILRAALRLASGPPAAGEASDAGEPDPAEIDPRELAGILAANKIPLVSVARECEERGDPLWRRLERHPAFAQALERERALSAALLGPYLRLAAALRSTGIDPVLFKSPRWFPYLSSNLDVLVPPHQFRESARVIERSGQIRIPHYVEDHKVLFRTFENGEPSLSVHLHEAVSWGKVVIAGGAEVVQRGVPGEEADVRVAGAQDALAATLAHTILETDEVRLADIRILRWCLAHGAGVAALLEDAQRDRWEASAASALSLYDGVFRAIEGRSVLGAEDARLVRDALGRSPWTGWLLDRVVPWRVRSLPLRLPKWFSKMHLVGLVLADDRRDPERRLLDLAGSGWNLLANRLGVRCRPARLITISGPDGAGKSRLASCLAGALSLCEVPSVRVWSRGGFSALAVSGKALARRVAPQRVPGVADEAGKRDFLRSGWRRAGWAWAVALEQAASLLRLRVPLALGRSVVCDRYVYDSLADILARAPGRDGRRIPRRAAAFLMSAVPAPDLAFLIDVDPDLAHARKEDGTSVQARRDLGAAYSEIRSAFDFVRLDGALPFPEMAQAAVETTLRRTFEAFERGLA